MEEIWHFARIGDLESCRLLIEMGKDVNQINEWNANALFYAAHGGHIEVVKFLLQAGAVCEEGEFLGERCFYGALNDEIRSILKSFKYTAAIRSPYREFWRKTWEGRKRNCDFSFSFSSDDDIGDKDDEHSLLCHKVVLSVRCPRFQEMLLPQLKGLWTNHTTKTTYISKTALTHILCWLYTSRMEVSDLSVNETMHALTALGMDHVANLLLIQQQGQELVSQGKSTGRHAGRLVVEESDHQSLASNWQEFVAQSVLKDGKNRSFHNFADVCICVDMRYFYLHQFILENRSDYFKTLFASPLNGGIDDDTGMLTIALRDTTCDVFTTVVSFIYSNKAPDLLENSTNIDTTTRDDDVQMETAVTFAFDVLDCAERLMLPGLKTLVGAALRKILNCKAGDDPYPTSTTGGAGFVFEMLKVSRTFCLQALEDSCYEIIASSLLDMTNDTEAIARLQGFIVDDASTILHRQEADSIPILDEICTKIKKLFFRRTDRDFRVERLRSLATAIGFNVYYVEDDYDDD